MNIGKAPPLLSQQEVQRLTAIMKPGATIGLDNMGYVYTYVGRTHGTISDRGERLYVYSITKNGSQKLYGVAQQHIIMEEYFPQPGAKIMIHHLSRRYVNGVPEIVFIGEDDLTLAIIPLHKEVNGTKSILEL